MTTRYRLIELGALTAIVASIAVIVLVLVLPVLTAAGDAFQGALRP